MNPNDLTQALAIWGAVTGTIGTVAGIANLAIRYQQHKKDLPKLVCNSDFSFEHSSGDARPKHKIVLRSLGKRPVTVDFIRYCIQPKPLWKRLIKERLWKNDKWVYHDKPRNPIHITEGTKEDIKISFPNGVPVKDVIKVEVHDQTGVVWPVKWPTSRELTNLVKYEKLHESLESNEKRQCKISGYIAGNKYYIYLHWNPQEKMKNTLTEKFFHFNTKRQYDLKLKDIIDVQQPKLLACEINELN